MPKIYVEINRSVDFNIDIYDTPVGEKFFNQHMSIMAQDPVRAVPVITDFTKFTLTYFLTLIEQARNTCTVDWSAYQLLPGPENYEANQVQYNLMHKDLEVLAGLNHYAGLDEPQKSLIDEMHCCLHNLETTEAPLDYAFTGRTYANISYFVAVPEDNHMPEPVRFARSIQPGEIMLDYPYVGKEPFFCMMHNDNSLLQQTCKMIDRVSLNWKLHLNTAVGMQWGPPPWPDDVDAALTHWYRANQTDADALGYDLQKILDHTGFCISGKIDNLSKMEYLRNTPNIQVTGYQLIN
jgi:YHS domain-containing protein